MSQYQYPNRTGTKRKMIAEENWIAPESDADVYTWVCNDRVYLRNASDHIWEIGEEGEMGEYVGKYDTSTKQLNIVRDYKNDTVYLDCDLDGWVYPPNGTVYPWVYEGVGYYRCALNFIWEMKYDGTVGIYVGEYNPLNRQIIRCDETVYYEYS